MIESMIIIRRAVSGYPVQPTPGRIGKTGSAYTDSVEDLWDRAADAYYRGAKIEDARRVFDMMRISRASP